MRSDLGVLPRRYTENVPILVPHLHGQKTCETSSLLSTSLFAKQNALRAQQTSRSLCSRRPALGEVETRSPPWPASIAVTDPDGKQALHIGLPEYLGEPRYTARPVSSLMVLRPSIHSSILPTIADGSHRASSAPPEWMHEVG